MRALGDRWILGVIALVLIFGLAVLVTVVFLFRAGPIRGHPQPTATPATTTSAISAR